MNPWTLLALGFVVSALGLGWGLLLLISPRKFAQITRVDWMPEMINVKRKGMRLELRIIGFVTTALALWFLIMLIFSTHHLLEGAT